MKPGLDTERIRLALASSTLSHGLGAIGDRWTVQLLLGTFMGLKHFDQWQQWLGIPRSTLTQRLRRLQALGLLESKPYQHRPLRHAYHATAKALALYPQALMMWRWERHWGRIAVRLPASLRHKSCGQVFMPVLSCAACRADAEVTRMRLRLEPVPALLEVRPRLERTPGIAQSETAQSHLGLRVDRWSLLIITAVVLGCHYFDELAQVLGIGPSVLARRLEALVAGDLLSAEVDRHDTRRRIYRLTASSRDLLGYIVCLSHWAQHHHLHQPSSIIPTHDCGQTFRPQVVCSHCREPLLAWQVEPIDEQRQAA